jgi:EpsI family protein
LQIRRGENPKQLGQLFYELPTANGQLPTFTPMSSKTTLTIAFVSVIAFAATTYWLQRGYSFTVAAPTQQLSSFPLSFDGWQGQAEEITDGVANILDATDMLSLRFERGTEGPVFVHASTWTHPDNVAETCPHHPDICYRGNGWAPTGRSTMQIPVDGVGTIPVQCVVMQRGDQQVVVAFTYRMGDKFFADEASARTTQVGFFGSPVWPAVTKFMMQTTDPDIATAKPTIESFVKEFFKWHKP